MDTITFALVTDYLMIVFTGRDVIAQAQSGTGKTATFSIAILQQLDLDLTSPQALVLAPTRELAQQVKQFLLLLLLKYLRVVILAFQADSTFSRSDG